MDNRGVWLALDPEETRRAMMAAIARDIEAGVENEVMDQWRIGALSCAATFHAHAIEATRLQAATQLCENIANDQETTSRTPLQHIFELSYSCDVRAACAAATKPPRPT